MLDLTDFGRVDSLSTPAAWHLPPEASELLARVAATDLPVLCTDCYGPAFERVASLLHRASGREELVVVDLRASGGVLPAGLPAGARAARTTLALDGVERLAAPAQTLLTRELEAVPYRVVSAIDVPLDALREAFRPDLFALLSTVVVRTPALARRGPELAGLVRARLAALCARLGRPPADLAPSAIAALEAHPWRGDLAELDAVLARTLLASEQATIEAEQLRWAPEAGRAAAPGETAQAAGPEAAPRGAHEVGPEVAPPAPPSPAPPEPALAGGDGSPTLEALAVELAHQLKNPLVTVKTFVASVESLCHDPHELSQFRALTEEAVSRMDAILDGLLSFARLGPPSPAPLDALGLLRDALRTTWPGFMSKQVTLEAPEGATLHARSDAEHLRFAFATLARHVAETIEPRGTLTIAVEPETGQGLRFAYRESGAVTHLRGVAQGRESSLPLALLLVRGALGRVGGGVEITLEGNAVVIRLRLSPP